MQIEQVLNNIVQYLTCQNINFSNNYEDGRVNSIANESEVLKIIEKNFEINIPTSRSWADFFICDTIPVNIKITTTKTADNMSSKKGIYYALTGQIYPGNDSWENYLRLLRDNIKETDKDYYFLVCNKDSPTKIFFNSLKSLQSLTPNGNNLPFQIKWSQNENRINRNFEDAKKLILTTLGVSITKRADAYISFKKYFKEYIE